jgi:hypothetical protein
VTLCSSSDAAVRTIAFKYLCDNIPSKYPGYNPDNFGHIAFIPSEDEDGTHLGRLGEVHCPHSIRTISINMVTSTDLGVLWDSVESPRFLSRSRQLSRSCRQ